tara:strand:- start:428 stop:835 length:408 start_codon:yes stop_codon:yes gene_type:complete
MAKRRQSTKRSSALRNGYRSGLEEEVDAELKQAGINGQYEENKLHYTKPSTNHTYTPDFRLPNGIYIETKGRFVLADRQKHILLKKQLPDIDLRFVFQNSRNKIRKGSKTTYADWCIKHGFLYSDKDVPNSWINE